MKALTSSISETEDSSEATWSKRAIVGSSGVRGGRSDFRSVRRVRKGSVSRGCASKRVSSDQSRGDKTTRPPVQIHEIESEDADADLDVSQLDILSRSVCERLKGEEIAVRRIYRTDLYNKPSDSVGDDPRRQGEEDCRTSASATKDSTCVGGQIPSSSAVVRRSMSGIRASMSGYLSVMSCTSSPI